MRDSGSSNYIEDLYNAVPISQPKDSPVQTKEQNRLFAYLGTRTWFWRLTVTKNSSSLVREAAFIPEREYRITQRGSSVVETLPRGSYRFFLTTFPGLKEKEIGTAVEFQLPRLYPGNLESMAWEYRQLPGKDNSVLILILDKSDLKKNTYIPLFHCIDCNIPRRGENLMLTYSAAYSAGVRDHLTRNNDDTWSFNQEGSLLSKTRGTDWKIESPPAWREKKLNLRSYRGAFNDYNYKTGKSAMSRSYRIILLLILAMTGILIYGNRAINSVQQKNRELTRQISIHQERIQKTAAITGEINALTSRLDTVRQKSGMDPWIFLNSLSYLLPEGTEILSISARGSVFSVELQGKKALALGDALSRNPWFSTVEFQEIRLSEESGLARYRISGTFLLNQLIREQNQ